MDIPARPDWVAAMPTDILFDRELIRRHDRPGPRYTSYPTAPQFTDAFDEEALREHARQANQEPIPRAVSLYVHVPFCESPCFYCGCNRVITRDKARGEAYLLRLYREIEMMAPLVDRDREVVQLHLGGGTPNFLSPEQIGELVEVISRHFRMSRAADRDFSIEIDPRHVTPADIHALAAIGFNRVSLGVQDFDPEVQLAVNRVQGVEDTLAVIRAAREAGMRSVNVDLIYGLPRQSPEGFGRTLDTVVAARPDRLAVYSYAHLPELFRAQRQIREEDLCPPEVKLSLLDLAIDRLGAAGYRYIGMDHFALPGDELSRALDDGSLQRNFMGYTTHAATDLIGLGVSAISHIGDSFSQNHRDLSVWQSVVDEGRLPLWRGCTLDSDDVLRADLIQRLMCQGEIDPDQLEDRHDIDFDRYFADATPAVEDLVGQGLLERRGRKLVATRRGRLLLRVIAMAFDRYLAKPGDDKVLRPRFSRAI